MLKFVLILGLHSKQRLVYPYIQREKFPSSTTGGKFLGLASEGTYRITYSFLNSITGEIQSQIFPYPFYVVRYLNTSNLYYKSSIWMLFLLEFEVVLYRRSVRLCYTRGNFSLVPRVFQATLLYSYYPLWNHFEPPDEKFFSLLVTNHVTVLHLQELYLISLGVR